jgi:hypothetical protein
MTNKFASAHYIRRLFLPLEFIGYKRSESEMIVASHGRRIWPRGAYLRQIRSAASFGVSTALINNKARPPGAADIVVSLARGPGRG